MTEKMIRTVKVHSPTNKGKLQKLKDFLLVYNNCVNYFIHRLWSEKIFQGKFLDSNYIETAKKRFPALTTRLIQSAGKQAFEMVKSQRKRTKRQQRMPRFDKLSATLDSRFWQINSIKNSFEWLKIQSGFKFEIPFKRTIMWQKWEKKGFTLANSIRLKIKSNSLWIEFIFKKDKPEAKKEGKIVGADLGYVNLATLSDGQRVGITMNKFIENFDRREKNTYIQVKQKAFQELKKIDFSNIKVLVLEKLKNVKKDKRGMFSRRFNRRLSHWLYAKTTQWLEQCCEELGVGIEYKSPFKTSQYCRLCGNWDKRNRRGEEFRCVHCGFIENADYNAAKNLELLGLAGVYSLRSLPSEFIGCNKCL